MESLLTQTLIIHVIRTDKVPFVQSRASWSLTATTTAIVILGVALPFSLVGRYLGFSSLPRLYWVFLALTLASYVLLTQGVKTALLRRGWI